MFKTYVLKETINESIKQAEEILNSTVQKEDVKARIIANRQGVKYKTNLLQFKKADKESIQKSLQVFRKQLNKKFATLNPNDIYIEIAPLRISGYKISPLPNDLDKAFESVASLLASKKCATKIKVLVRVGNNIDETTETFFRKYSQDKVDAMKSEILIKFDNRKTFDQILLLSARIGNRIINCPNCKKEMRSDVLTRHLKKCATENFCPVCQKEVIDDIKQHMENCNKVQYQCRTCGEGFNTGSRRAAHEKRCQIASTSTVQTTLSPTSDLTAIGGTFRVVSIKPKTTSRDYEGILEDELPHIRDILKSRMETGLKFYISIELKMSRINDKDNKKLIKFQTSSQTLFRGESMKQAISKHIVMLVEKIELYVRNGSGWNIENAEEIKVMITKYSPVASSFIKLPKQLKGKTSLLNIDNRDNKCFLWSCLAALHPEITQHRTRVGKYYAFENELNMDGIDYPVSLNQIKRVEMQNNLAINVFTWDKGEGFYPLRVSQVCGKSKEINLLLIANQETQHYVLIKSLSGLLSSRTKYKNKMHYCFRCLHGFKWEESLRKHKKDCKKFKVQRTEMPFEKHLEFKSFNKMIRYPLYIVADFESVISRVDYGTGATLKTAEHIPCAYALKIVSRFEELRRPVESYRGEDAAQKFILRINEIYEEFKGVLFMNAKMENETPEIKEFLKNQVNCHICNKPLGAEKHLDHSHYTGQILGYSHPVCNTQRKMPKRIPIIFHNFKNYDCHLLIKELCDYEQDLSKVQLIPKTMEKYTSVITQRFKFIDSAQHLQMSLEKLVDNLKNSGIDNFKRVKSYIKDFHQGDEEKFDLLLRKGVFPYAYVDSFTKFSEPLPERSAFYDDLNQKKCSKKDYEHVKAIFTKFSLSNLGDLCDLYVISDVLLLADVFQQYINESWKNFGLDPLHYYTLPGLSWDAGLKMTKVKLEMIRDENMYMFCEKAIRGGVSVISKRKASANNKYMVNFNPLKPCNFLWYIDANNLYGKSMIQKMPISGFKWSILTEKEILDYDSHGNIGYFLEVDLSFPNHTHDRLNCFPIAPELFTINEEIVSDKSLQIRQKRYDTRSASSKQSQCEAENADSGMKRQLKDDLNPSRKRIKKNAKFSSTKLAPNLFPKKNYICHIRNLQFCLQQGARLDKIYRVLQFNQESWIEPYIMFNTKQRQAEGATEFKKSFHKLLNNAFFGKTMESVRKRINIVLIRKEHQQRFQVSKPGFQRFEIFGDDLVGVELTKPVVKLDKPIYVGATVLELSKLTMFEFWYNVIKPRFPACTLCFTDTDSLLIDIPTDDLYTDLVDIKEHLDLSNYPKDHKLYDSSNKACLGKFKDETKGNVITDFIGLRSKCYSILAEPNLQEFDEDGSNEDSDTDSDMVGDKIVSKDSKKQFNKAAGVKKHAKRIIDHEKYQQTLDSECDHMITQNLLRSYQHTMHSVTQTKVGLTAYDDKRYLLNDGKTTRAHGHYLNSY